MIESLSPIQSWSLVIAWLVLMPLIYRALRWRFDHRWRAERKMRQWTRWEGPDE